MVSLVVLNWLRDLMVLVVVLNLLAIVHSESPFLTTYSNKFPLSLVERIGDRTL